MCEQKCARTLSVSDERESAVATKSPAEETSDRKRISIPKADKSVLEWWEAQKDPGLSVRLLIRTEIERSGNLDVAFRPVTQLMGASDS